MIRKFIWIFLVLTLFFNNSLLAEGENKEVRISLELSPAGDFDIIYKRPKGVISKSGESISSEKVFVKSKRFSTGVELRDTHVAKRLEVEEFPTIEVTGIKGTEGKGTGTISVKGIQKEINFSYTKINDELMEANFNLSLKDFKIEDIEYMGIGVQDTIKLRIRLPFSEEVKEETTEEVE